MENNKERLEEERLEELVKRLREEANSLKDCFTKFFFQGLAFSGVILGVIATCQQKNPYVALAGLLVTVVLLTVARIGTYKYGSANRHFGFELHLNRTRDLKSKSLRGWQPTYRYVDWEEAMRGWRIVQATIFKTVYHTEGCKKNKEKDHEIEYRWWCVSNNLKCNETSNATYWAGSYIHNTQNSSQNGVCG